jgi:hypothetical protein
VFRLLLGVCIRLGDEPLQVGKCEGLGRKPKLTLHQVREALAGVELESRPLRIPMPPLRVATAFQALRSARCALSASIC